jgi:hypothetical protein
MNHCRTKAGKETLFCRTHRNQKDGVFSFYLLLYEVEYKMVWRLVGCRQDEVLLSVIWTFEYPAEGRRAKLLRNYLKGA